MQNTRSAMTYLLEQLAYDASDLSDETRRDGAGGVVQRRVTALARDGDYGGMLPEAMGQARIRKPRLVRARLSSQTEPLRGKDGICDVDEC